MPLTNSHQLNIQLKSSPKSNFKELINWMVDETVDVDETEDAGNN